MSVASRCRFLLCLPPLLVACTTLVAATLVIEGFDYSDDAAAQAAWIARAGSQPVEMVDSGEWGEERVMKLPCNFSVQPTRSYWDRYVSLDLSGYAMFELEVFVADPSAISWFTLYFHSGDGWYAGSLALAESGWQTLRFASSEFIEEGIPGGWQSIDTIRLSAWKGSEQDTYLAVRELRAVTPLVLIVRDADGADSTTVERTVELLSGWLDRYAVQFGVLDEQAVEEGYLTGSRMAILPHNETISDTQMAALDDYVTSGGKLMVHYLLNDGLEDLLGIDRTGWIQSDFAAFTFADDEIRYLPERVSQDSWNITIATPRAELNARVIAEWEDESGLPTGHPAWLASDNGLFMSHILLSDDPSNKQLMLLGLIGHYVPEIWPEASTAAIARIGLIAEYESYEEAVQHIGAQGSVTPRRPQVEAALNAAAAARAQAIAEQDTGNHAEAVLTALDAREYLLQAYYRCQSPTIPEFRAVWEHGGTGPYPGDWSAAIDPLVANGLGAVFPNMLRGGLAHYDSMFLPHSEEFETYGDQVVACVDAASTAGIEVHIWKVNWNLARSPQSFIEAMRAAERTQVSWDGVSIDWLCPSHPDNFALERDSMLEVVQNYDIDGIHFDYIRYPNSDYCYCDGCRGRFETETGHVVVDWPADVRPGGPMESAYLDWRREQITELVEAVYAATKAVKPHVQVSAAVFADYASAFDGVGQDWVSWINGGIVDLLFPMDYTIDFDRFREVVAEQMAHAAGRIPIYPGIAASLLDPDGVVVQVEATRTAETGGFILFDYRSYLTEQHLPALAMGTTLPGGAAETPDGTRVPGAPLTIAKVAADQLRLQWDHSCDRQPGITEYVVYQGSIESLGSGGYDHTPLNCGGSPTISEQVAIEPGNHYFLIVPTDTNREGGYGFDSTGTPRPSSTAPCLPQLAMECP